MAMTKGERDPSAPQARCASLADLPTAIFYEIVLKLPTWSIVMSKCVCRAWRDLISDPQFAKVHVAQATPCPLLRNCHHLCISRALYLLEPVGGGDLGAGYSCCDFNSEGKVKVKYMLKIPMRNAHSMLRCVDIANTVFSTNEQNGIQASVKVTSKNFDHRYGTVTSCNGILCILDPYNENECTICNPITGEFIHLTHLPNRAKNKFHNLSISLGFSRKSDQYKVLHVFSTDHEHSEFAAEIHTLGETSWRSLGDFALKLNHWDPPIYFNGALHWLCYGDNKPYFDCIACFDLDEERFRPCSIPLPVSLLCLEAEVIRLTISVMGGRLCVTSFSKDIASVMYIWAMDVYGAAESWTKLASGDDLILRFYKPLSRLSGGGLLLFADEKNALIYCYKSKECKYKRVTTFSQDAAFVALDYTPNFVSLKTMVNSDDVEVFNVYSGCGKIKLKEEAYPLFLEEVPSVY